MKILQVIHGYPMRYNAGSEVYTQTLSQGLAQRHQVHVFTREEDSFAPDFAVRQEVDESDPRVKLHVINIARSRDRYRHVPVDQRFANLLDELKPDIVHIGHLNHLSTSLVAEAASRRVPIVYTLHDYWVMCPRGQFMQMDPEDPTNLWAACDGQENRKCAERCYSRYFSGAPDEYEHDVKHWEHWVARRMQHVRAMVEMVDLFIAPSQYLFERYRDYFHLPAAKLRYLDYGFATERLTNRTRTPGEAFTFGYIGTHIPAKGIHQLIEAFVQVRGHAKLRIWGRPRGQDTESLRTLAKRAAGSLADRIEWLPEYRNQEIVQDVFNRVDAIVVPSVWVENSPLVIHEAQQVRVPVITADVGGMGEYVHHEVNGLLFKHRDVAALTEQMQRFVDDPQLAQTLGSRGYLQSSTGNIPNIEQHVEQHEEIYRQLIERKQSSAIQALKGPWRITFDTNPDTCNLKCVMCEEHSEHSLSQIRRKDAREPRREMPIELLEKIVAEAVPRGLREVIPSTMGEPLLYDDFERILQVCAKHQVKLNLTTNGTFPRLGARAWAEKIVPLTSDVKISWNGATQATHERIMVGSNWEHALENVRTFVQVRDAHAAAGGNRCRVTFQLTFLEENVRELGAIVRLAASLGVDRVKGHHLWAHFDEIKNSSMRRSPEAIARWNAAVAEAQAAARDFLLPNGKSVLLENIFPLSPTATADIAPGGPCPFLGQEAWVSAVGRFSPCCAPDAERRTLGEFGNLNERGMLEIWDGTEYQQLIATYANRPLCLRCNMRQAAKPATGEGAE